MFTAITADGLVVTGFKIKDDDRSIVLREPAGGKEIEIPKDDIDDLFESRDSAMPQGLVSQLQDRSKFLDLVRFLIEVNEGGQAKMKELKASAGASY